MKRTVRTRLDYTDYRRVPEHSDTEIEEHDGTYKRNLEVLSRNRNTKCRDFVVGVYVLLRQPKRNMVDRIWTTILHNMQHWWVKHRSQTNFRPPSSLPRFKPVQAANALVGEAPISDTTTQCEHDPDWREQVLAGTRVDTTTGATTDTEQYRQHERYALHRRRGKGDTGWSWKTTETTESAEEANISRTILSKSSQ